MQQQYNRHRSGTFSLLLLLASITVSQALSPEEAVEASLRHHPGVRATLYRIEATRALTQQARAAYWPHVQLASQYTRSDNPSEAFMMELNQRHFDMRDPARDFNHPGDTENIRLSARAHLLLFDGGQRQHALSGARQQTAAERCVHRAFRNQLVYEVMEAYYRALQARDQLAVQDSLLTSMQENLRVARQRLEAGAVVITDVLNLEVQLEQAREDKIRATHAAQLTVAALNTSMGVELATLDSLQEPSHVLPLIPPSSPLELEQHPQLQAMAYMAQALDAETSRQRRTRWPTLSAFGSLDWDSPDATDYAQSYRVGMMAQWDAFDGFYRDGAIREARAREAEAFAQMDQTRNRLELELQQARIRAEDAKERIAVTRTSSQSAKAALTATREQYEQGSATLSDLLTAQSAFTAMQTRHTAARYDYLTALANLERALGRLPASAASASDCNAQLSPFDKR